MSLRRIAIYDLDKTLTRHATYTPFLIYTARHLHPWRLAFVPIWILLLLGYVCRLYDRGWLKQTGFRLLVGRADDPRLAPVIEAFAARVVAAMQPCARQQWDGDAEATRIIATAALELYASAIADRLGADHLIATAITADGRRIEENGYGQVKAARVLAWFAELGLERSACSISMWSDSTADAPLLDWADDAVHVTSNHRLADERGWRSVDFSGR
jgi:phosphatidylglycerophosphatase C